MNALIIFGLFLWVALGLLLVLNIESILRRVMSWGAWEHEPFSPSALNSEPSQPPRVIINDLARTGALECPRAVPSVSQPSTLNSLN